MTIDEICKQYNIKNYTINTDGTIDVDGYVYLHGCYLNKIPLKFNRVSGGFKCNNNKLTSLEGCPNYVGGYFDCSMNELTSFEGCPNYVGGNFYCYANPLPQEFLDNPKAEIIRLYRNRKLDILLNE